MVSSIYLRKYRNRDANSMVKLDCSPKEYQDNYSFNAVTSEEFKAGYTILRKGGYNIYTVIKKEIGKHNRIIGMALFRPDGELVNNRRHVEYYIDKQFQRKGYGTKVLEEMIKIARFDLELNKLIAEPWINNVGSKRILDKNGFQRIGVRRQHEPQIWNNSKYDDVVLYELLLTKPTLEETMAHRYYVCTI